MKRIAILDPFAGISGDMTLGALVDIGVPASWLEGLPARVGFPGVGVRVERATRGGVTATKIQFAIPEGEGDRHGRHVGELVEVVRRASVSDSVRHSAIRAFELVGEAEGKIHGVAPHRVHLHEVGAVDAVLDIVGAVEGFEKLGVEAVYNLPVAVGDGWVEAAHGTLPVPAPATSLLLEGIEVRTGGPVRGEATTPTGAALIRVLSRGAPPGRWRPRRTGWGAGDRDPAAYPNALRLLVADGAVEAGIVEVIVTDVDDLPPEYVEPLREALVAAGALDCALWATHGKKGRMGVRLEVLATPEGAERVIETLFTHSTTGGIRRWQASRATLPRGEVAVEVGGAARVRVKAWDGPAGPRYKPEYADVVAAAARLGRPALDVAREAHRLASAVAPDGQKTITPSRKE